MQKIIRKIKNRSIWLWEIVSDPILRNIYPQPKIATMQETISRIIEYRSSMARYGDGELNIMKGQSIPFQKYNFELGKKMQHLLKLNDDNFLICLPEIFGDLNFYKDDAKKYWQRNIRKNRRTWNKYLSYQKQYYNAYVSRFYYGFKDKTHCEKIVKQLKQIWKERDLLIVEGEKSRLGVGNDLFDDARSIKRILCPATDAFSVYTQIVNSVRKYDTESLVLLALGPTATAMAYDLYKLGYQTLDIGHIDIEYEWYLMKADTKVAIKNKYTNEATTDEATNIGESSDEKYLSQIVDEIKG